MIQEQNVEEMTGLYEELTILLSQLNEDAPKIKRMYSSIEKILAKQETIAVKTTKDIEVASEAGVSRVKKETMGALEVFDQYLHKAEMIARRCETALAKIEEVAVSVKDVQECQARINRCLADLENKLQTAVSAQLQAGTGVMNAAKTERTTEITSLYDYFKANGFKVVDNRSTGGPLWVIGSEEELFSHVEYVKKCFGVSGTYHTGVRATNYKPAWWTKSKK